MSDIPGRVLGYGSYGVIVGTDKNCRKIFSRSRAMSFIREAFVVRKLSYIKGITEIVGLDYPTSQDTRAINQVRKKNTKAWGVIVMKQYALTLSQWLRNCPLYEDRIQIFRDIISIMVQIHAAGVIHADLKLENIMLTSQGEVRIIDWGLSSFKGYARVNSTTKIYRPHRAEQDYCHDIYALGVVAIQLILGRLIVNPVNYILYIKMLDQAIEDAGLRKLICRMINPDCKNRPTIKEVDDFLNQGKIPRYRSRMKLSRDTSYLKLTPENPKEMRRRSPDIKTRSDNLIHLDIPSTWPEMFNMFLRSNPEFKDTIIGIITAIYSYANPSNIISKIHYAQVLQFFEQLSTPPD